MELSRKVCTIFHHTTIKGKKSKIRDFYNFPSYTSFLVWLCSRFVYHSILPAVSPLTTFPMAPSSPGSSSPHHLVILSLYHFILSRPLSPRYFIFSTFRFFICIPPFLLQVPFPHTISSTPGSLTICSAPGSLKAHFLAFFAVFVITSLNQLHVPYLSVQHLFFRFLI